MADPHDLFFSYRTARAAEVAPLIAALEARGLRVWQDVQRVDHGASISDAVRAGLASSRALLAYWSADYPESRICLWELTLATVLAERDGSASVRVGLLCAPGLDVKDVTGPIKDSKAFSAEAGWEAAADQILSWLAGLRGANGDQRRLGELGPVSGVRWVPHRRVGSTRFVGREAELWALHGHLRAGVISGRPTAQAQLRGMAGLGKSLTALEYANRFEAAWPGGIFVLDAGEQDPGRLLGDVASAIGVPDDVPPANRAAAARRKLADKAEPYLWLVDNLPPGMTHKQAEAWVAPGAKGATLFTTRGRGLNALGRSIDLDVLSEIDALRLLRGPDALSGEEEADAKVLLREVGYLPLAVDVLRALIERDQRAGRARPYRRWLERLARPDKEDLDLADALLKSESLPTDPSKNVAALLRAAMEGLGEPAWDVLRVCAALADAPVPRALVEIAVGGVDGLEPEGAEDLVDCGVEELWGRSLVQAEGGELRLHALVRRVAARQDRDLARGGALSALLPEALRLALGDVQDNRTHATSASLVPHVERLLSGEWDMPRAGLAVQFANRERAAGSFARARRNEEKALEAQTRSLGAEHPDTLRTLQNLAGTLSTQGDPAGARRLLDQALEAQTRLLGAEHPDTLATLQNLAVMLEAQGDFAGARRLYEQALEARTRLLGAEHRVTLGILNNLAGTLDAQGDLAGARRLYEQALEAQTRLLGAEHPNTLITLHNLACTLLTEGDFAGARQRFELARDAMARLLGAEHPETLRTVQNLAVALAAQGDFAGAARLCTQALEAQTRLLGTEHPDTQRTRFNLLLTLQRLGDARAMTTHINALRPLLGADPATLSALQRHIRAHLPALIAAHTGT